MVLGFRDQRRIERMLELLGRYWRTHPDLRLGQIVGNFTPRLPDGEPGVSYYVEDDVIESRLRAALKEG